MEEKRGFCGKINKKAKAAGQTEGFFKLFFLSINSLFFGKEAARVFLTGRSAETRGFAAKNWGLSYPTALSPA